MQKYLKIEEDSTAILMVIVCSFPSSARCSFIRGIRSSQISRGDGIER
jgi:hypothetical protein